MILKGFHHLTAITADAPRNYRFYTQVLGLRLVKKTVNQDDASAYHLFYADGQGSPGTDITFFDWPVASGKRGTHSICRTGFRIPAGSLGWWHDRLETAGYAVSAVTEEFGRATLNFEDFEGLPLAMVEEEPADRFVWTQSTVPEDYQIIGLGPITMSVPKLAPTEAVLTHVLGLSLKKQERENSLFEMQGKGALYQLLVREEPRLPPAQQGFGSVHHLAFNIAAKEYQDWGERLRSLHVPNSGPVDRFWFKSLYFREPSGVLFELATDQPGFATDETIEQLGTTLSLPLFLEARLAQIESALKPL